MSTEQAFCADPWSGLNPPYATIVADPPWPYPDGVSAGGSPGRIHSFKLPYSALAIEDICAMPVAALADDDAWLFLWTTNRHLVRSFDVIAAWGFRYRQLIVWHKPGASPFGGTFAANGGEYLIGAARGNPALIGRWQGSTILTHNRPGAGKHSTKPAAFLDLVETCCPGPYVELFARSPRLGWDSWGHGWEQAS